MNFLYSLPMNLINNIQSFNVSDFIKIYDYFYNKINFPIEYPLLYTFNYPNNLYE